MSTITEAINNLDTTSQELERLANNPKHFNTDFAYYLEQMSWEMYRMKNDLKGQLDFYGDLT